MIGVYITRTRPNEGSLTTINRSFYISAVISAVLCAIAAYVYLPGQRSPTLGRRMDPRNSPTDTTVVAAMAGTDPRLHRVTIAVIIGIVLAGVILWLTGYFTGTEDKPVKTVGESSLTGAATVILAGISIGFESAVYTALVIGAAVFGAFALATGSVTVVAVRGGAGRHRPAHHGRRHRRDGHLRPGRDNAQGIAEMSGDVDRRRGSASSPSSTPSATPPRPSPRGSRSPPRCSPPRPCSAPTVTRSPWRTAWPVAGLKTVGRLEGDGACDTRVQWGEAQGQAQLRVDGSWGPRCGQRPLWLVPPADADLFGRMVAGLWQSVGGRLTGRVRPGSLRRLRGDGLRLPLVDADGVPLEPWQRLPSLPLGEVIRIIDKQSHNLAARHLMLSLSPGFPARAASLEGARERVRDWLLGRGLTADELVLDNGSGLSRAERGSPRALTRLLVRAARRPTSLSFLESLPVAGQDGTLANRLEHGAAAGKAFLKTGSLLDARALAGYVNAGSGTVYTMVVLLNHPQAASGQATLDRLVEWVARHG